MNNLEKEFVPFEIALELKQLGFDDEVIATYPKNRRELKLNNVKVTETTKAILFQQAFRWFRENYSLQGIIWSGKISTVFYGYNILNISKQKYIINNTELGGGDCDYDTYEEAELACLKKLIEIVQGGNK